MLQSQMPQQILIVDDHELVLSGAVVALKERFPTAQIATAQTAQQALEQMQKSLPDIVVMDLSMPEIAGELTKVETGIQLVKQIMTQYPHLNIVIQSAHARSLIRLKPIINTHEGGFTIAEKSLPLSEMLTKVEWAMQGIVYTPRDMRNGLEVRPEWLQVLKLAFEEGLQDRAIAERIKVAERTVRYYWNKIQDVLEVYPEAGKNIRVQTELRARQAGLID